MAAEDFNLGYEIEMLTYSTSNNVISRVERLVHQLPVIHPHTISAHWSVHGDGSIREPRASRQVGREISSGVMDYNAGLMLLKKIFDDMKASGDHTNDSCGFHVNLSFKDLDKNQQIDRVALVSYLDEDRQLKTFGRTSNRYCQSHRRSIRMLARDLRRYQRDTQSKLANACSAGIDDAKYRTVNFGKLRQNYLEFRIIGGSNYHTRYDEIVKSIEHFRQAMEFSIAPKGEQYQELVQQLATGCGIIRKPRKPGIFSQLGTWVRDWLSS